MIQNPAIPDNTPPTTFPLVSAEACTCCGRALSQGYDVPYVGVVGPKCVRKYAALAAALARLDVLTITPAHPVEARHAVNNLVLVLRNRIGYAVELVDQADGSKSIRVGARTREYGKVCKTWKERRAEFERELQLAEAHLAVQQAAAPAPVLTEEAVAAMTLGERRTLAAEHGVLTPGGKPSTSVALIWAAVSAAQLVADAPAARALPSMAVRLTTGRPWAGRTVTALARRRGTWMSRAQARRTAPVRFEQPEQRHYAAAVAEAAPERAVPLNGSGTYLSELSLPVPAAVAYAYPPRPSRYERGGQGGYHIELGAALTHGRIRRKAGDTLCGKTFWGLDTRDGRYAVTCKRCLELAARFDGPHEQVQQQQTQAAALAPVVLVDCAECEGTGRVWHEVSREYDGTPIEARLTCKVCHGDCKVSVPCPECLGGGIALVVSDWDPSHEWCLKCALEAIELGDDYTAEQVAEIRAQAAAAGLLVPQPQPEQQQAQGLTEEEHDRLLEFELDAQDALEAATRRPVFTRRPLTEHEQEDRWQQDDLMERRAAFLREDY